MTNHRSFVWIGAIPAVLVSACGGGDSGNDVPPPPPATYSIAGTLTGLAGSVTLQNNGTDAIALSTNGSFVFPTRMNAGSTYSVSVATQPLGPDCVVTNGSGTVTAAVSNVTVACTVTPDSWYLPFLAFTSDNQVPAGLYAQATKTIESAPRRITSSSTTKVALIPQLTVVGGTTVTSARPAALIYRTVGNVGGDHLWRLDLTGGSDLTPTQIGSLTIFDGIAPAPAGANRLCDDKMILRKLDDPGSAFHVLTVSSNFNSFCTDSVRRVVVYPNDSPITAPREVPASLGDLEPVYGAGGTLAGMLLVNTNTNILEFFRDETFTNPVEVLPEIGGIWALREASHSPWTEMAGSQGSLVIHADNGGGSALYAISASGTATMLYDDTGVTSEIRVGANLYVQNRDMGAGQTTYQYFRIPVDASSGPQLLWSYMPSAGCHPDNPVGVLGSKLILERLCIASPSQAITSRILSAASNVPGTPDVLATYSENIYGMSLAQDRLLVTLSERPTLYFSPDQRYSTEVVSATGSVLQSRSAGAVFPILFADPTDSTVQIRDIAGTGVRSGGMYKVLLGPSGALTTSRLLGMDGSHTALSSDTSILGSVIGVGAGRAYGTFGGGSVETDLLYDLQRGLAVKLSPPGVSGMSLITYDSLD